TQPHDVLSCLHTAAESREVADSEHPVSRQTRELQPQLRHHGESAFGADQQSGEVGLRSQQLIEIVSADAPLQLGKHALDLITLALGQRDHGGRQAYNALAAM